MKNDLLKNYYLFEKQFFDKLNIDGKKFKVIGSLGKIYTEIFSRQIKNYSNFLK